MLYKPALTYLQIIQYHQLEQNPEVLSGNQRGIWRNIEQLFKYLLTKQMELFYKQINWAEQIKLFYEQTKKQKNKSV